MNFWNRDFIKSISGKHDTYLQSLTRYIVAPFVVLFSKTPITPNMVTITGGIFWAVAFLLWFLNMGLVGDIVAFVLFFLAYLSDYCDGSLARIKGMISAKGAYLDFLFDTFRNVFLYTALAYRAWSVTGDVMFLHVYIAFVITVLVARNIELQKVIIQLKKANKGEKMETTSSFVGSKNALLPILINLFETIYSIALFHIAALLFFVPYHNYIFVKVFFVTYIAFYVLRTIITLYVTVIQINKTG